MRYDAQSGQADCATLIFIGNIGSFFRYQARRDPKDRRRARGRPVNACAGLNGFISLVKAQKGKKLNNLQVADFVAQANAIRTTLGC